jgi:ABC-2 type transport system permease protein
MDQAPHRTRHALVAACHRDADHRCSASASPPPLRDSAAAVAVVLGLLYLFPLIAALITDPNWSRRLQQIGPMSAGLAIQATTGLHRLPIAPWTGLTVLAAWAIAALLAGALLLHRRDA